MNIGKTNYKFQINADSNLIDKIIKDWLVANKFEFTNKYNEDMYYCYDTWSGNRGFQYTIDGNTLNIYAWTIGMGNKFYMLDSGAFNNMPGDTYKNILVSLLNQINQYCNQDITENIDVDPNYNNNQIANNSVSQVANNLEQETTKKKEKLCNIGFWLSLVGLILVFFGAAFGIPVYIVNFYLASQGLQTSKKNKAIASIIISILSIMIVIIQVLSILFEV